MDSSSSSPPPSMFSPPSLSVLSVNNPAPSSRNWTHDVFPSFRGEDVRTNILSHIRKEFRRKGITTFIDNEIKRGESIGPELIRAIRESKIAMVLVSKKYASSKWCLDELVEIMKCREEKLGQTVIPIFYEVDPSDVKKLAGDFGKVFDITCEGQSKEDIERWRQSLVKVATTAGYDSRKWDNEADMIEKIATEVSNTLINSIPSSDFDRLVGMNAHMESMNSFLHSDSNEVKMIGIWGPSGIGKSTIARVLFSRHFDQFQHSVFMEDIKRRYQNIHGYDSYSVQLRLQEDFLSQILNQKDIKIRHLGVVQDRLKDKRVFVVLDDVDHSMQLEAVVKELRWFGPGSRIIITTQDEKVLTDHKVNHIYEVDFSRDDEALEIFCTYAFDQKYPKDGFEKLAWEVTQVPFAGKLPLGLKVMASHLKKMPIETWKEEVPKLQASLEAIDRIFGICYNALRPEEKELFLYIACIFNNERIDKVKAHLAHLDVSEGLRMLDEKSLITITDSGDIAMHDLPVRFGRDIVRKQSGQFLVDTRDISKVLNNTASRGTGIVANINISKISEIEDELNKCKNAVESMSSLQFLRLGHDIPPRSEVWKFFLGKTCLPSQFNSYRNLTHILKNLPQEIRLLDWRYFPMSSLQSPEFNPESLVELKMQESKLRELWSRNKTIKNLKWMDLSFSENLRRLPDLSTATNLQELNLGFCKSLKKLSSSIGNAINLQKLNLSYCKSLQMLPSSIGNAINLQNLDLQWCSSLRELPSSIGNAINLQNLDLQWCTSLQELPSSIGNAINLQNLDLQWCSSLQELPSSIGNAINLQNLDLQWCTSLQELPSSIGNAINLKELNLSSCSSLIELPPSIGNAISLRKLLISGCRKLVSLPQLPDSLETLDAEDCELLEKLHCSFHNTRLVELNLADCFKLNQEARNLIIKASTCKYAILPSEKVPPHFTYQAIGTSCSMELNGTDTHLPTSLTFQACFLLVKKGDVVDDGSTNITVGITEKQNGISVACNYDKKMSYHFLNRREEKHLYTYEFEGEVSSSGLVFEFETDSKEFLIAECGISILS